MLPNCHTPENLVIAAFTGPDLCIFRIDVSAYLITTSEWNMCIVLSSLDSCHLCTRVVRLHYGGAAGLFGGAAQAYNMSFRGRLRREVVSRQCLDGGTLEIQG